MGAMRSRLDDPFWSAAGVSVAVCLFLPVTFFVVLAWPDAGTGPGSEAESYQGLREILGVLLGFLSAPVLGALAALGSTSATAAALRDIRVSRPIHYRRVVLIASAPALLVVAVPILSLIAQISRKQPALYASNSLGSDLRIHAAVAVHVGIAGLLGAMRGATLARRTAGSDRSAASTPDAVHLATERGRVTGVIVALLFVSVVGFWALAAIDVWFALACCILAGITGYALGSGIGTRLEKEH